MGFVTDSTFVILLRQGYFIQVDFADPTSVKPVQLGFNSCQTMQLSSNPCNLGQTHATRVRFGLGKRPWVPPLKLRYRVLHHSEYSL